MMVRYELAGLDLAEIRFAVSPLQELALSLRVLRDPGGHPLHRSFLRQVRSVRAQLDHPVLLALTNPYLALPDLLTPRPDRPIARIQEQLDALAAAPTAQLRHDLAAVHPGGLPPALSGPAASVQRRVVAALREYWQACLEPHWPRLRQMLEADLTYRGRQTAWHGTAGMLAGLSGQVRMREGGLEIRKKAPSAGYTRGTDGSGLLLVPSAFSQNAMTPISAVQAPSVTYTARGVGTLWHPARPAVPQALAGLIGRARAELLAELEVPASSTELAARRGTTAAAVNQHLRALQAGGLLTSNRSGRSMLYRRSTLGDDLIRG